VKNGPSRILKNGATDYVLKHRLDRLPLAIIRAKREIESVNERQKHESPWAAFCALTMLVAAAFIIRFVRLLSQTERQFRRLLESAPEAVVVIDKEGPDGRSECKDGGTFWLPAARIAGRETEMLVPERFRQSKPVKRQELFRGRPRPGEGRGVGVPTHPTTLFFDVQFCQRTAEIASPVPGVW
jgi:PAS domain-containing protein